MHLYRCVVLPDSDTRGLVTTRCTSQCTYRCVVLPDPTSLRLAADTTVGLNAPTGAWCSLTLATYTDRLARYWSQCTYRCVVLPDACDNYRLEKSTSVSMHLQVRGAP